MTKVLILLTLLFNCGCVPFSQAEVREAVMTDGMKICATTAKEGTICIVAKEHRYRHLSWDGGTRASKVFPRKERWVGMLGLENSGYETWKPHKGITRANYEEGQYHFSSESEASNFFKKWYDDGTYVYRHDGLAVYYDKSFFKDKREGGVIQLMLFQFMINGEKPKNLSGSQDDMISVEFNVRP